MRAEVVASVHVGDVETQYWRAGHGAPVLLLVVPPHATLDQALLPDVRLWWPRATTVAGPRATAEESAFTRWLRGFLDGLGLGAVTVVAAPSLAIELAAFQATHPGYVTRVAWIADVPADWSAVRAALAPDTVPAG